MRRSSPAARRLLLAAVVTLVGLVPAAASATNDQHWPLQWAPAKIGAPAAWATTTGTGVRIGIVDSGVDLAHEDLAGKVVAHAACVDTDGDQGRCQPGGGQDDFGHGSHVAGIAAAIKDNGKGVAGIAPGASLVVARPFEGGSARISDVIASIMWVVDHGARVVNLSLGVSLPVVNDLFGSESLRPGVDYAWSKGAVPVLAAGNSNLFGLGSANYGDANALVVAATGRNDEVASYSSPTGDAKWALLAPGGNRAEGGEPSMIFSAWWRRGQSNQYAYEQGTSMAAPHVSGALALLLSRPGMTAQRAVEIVLGTADRRVRCGANSPNCVGRLDVAKAVAATGGPTTAAPAPPGPPPTAANQSRPAPRRTAAPPPPPAPTSSAPAPTPPELGPLTAAPEQPEVAEEPLEPIAPEVTGEVVAPEPVRDDEDGGSAVPAVVAAVLLVAVAAAVAKLARSRLG
jgi:hypothetical protein